MPKITVWKCPHSGQLFEDEILYRKHLGILKRQRARARLYQGFMDAVDSVVQGEMECKNAQELCEHVLAHSKEYMTKGALRDSFSTEFRTALRMGHEIQFPKYTGMKIYRARWSDSCSNSHGAPRGKRTNWGGNEKGEPRGYPGWTSQFRIWWDEDAKIRIINPKSKKKNKVTEIKVPCFSNCTDYNSGMHTGSGGGRNDGSYYSFTMFAADFPEMEKIVAWRLLRGPDAQQPVSSFGGPKFTEIDQMGEGRVGHVVDGDPF